MSLINEALKRAKESQNQSQTPAPASSPHQAKVFEPAMRPVEAKAQPTSSATVYVLCAALVFVLVSAGALLWMWSNSQQKSVVQPIPVAVAPVAPAPVPPVTAPVAPAPAPVVATKAPEAPIAVPANITTNAVVAPETIAKTEPVPAPEPAPPAPVVPQFPTLKLQGIFYNSAKPAVVINGKTYYVGSMVSGAKITKIEAESVTAEWNGETRVIETAQ